MNTNPTVQEKTILVLIKKIRRDKGYSQQYMAMQLGMDQSTYNKLEGGSSSLRMIHFLKICEVLEKPPVHLMNEALFSRPKSKEIKRVFSDLELLLSELKQISFS